MPRFREEKDSIGVVRVPAEAYHGSFTQRALENFPVSGLRPDPRLIRAIIEIKIAAARVHEKLGLLERRRARAIARAGKEALAGRFDGEFTLDIFTAGAGTPIHMNVNEVLANRANEILGGRKGLYDRVHPNDHVNLGQSSNDVFPTAIRIMALDLAGALVSAMKELGDDLERKARAHRRTLKSARTHLQDAVPITLGQELRAYASSVARARARLEGALRNVRRLGIGATAAGTGINSHARYARLVARELASATGLPLENARNLVEATSSMADFVELANALDEYATELGRIASDLRLLVSGPRTGLDEIALPEVEPGSSIMPGKVNPSVPEMVNMVCFQASGCAHAVRLAGGRGELDLNVFTPVIAFDLALALRTLASATRILARRAIRGLRANGEVCRGYAETSPGIATALTPVLGYARTAEIVKLALGAGTSIREALEAHSGLPRERIERLLHPLALTRPNLPGPRRARRARKRL
jgi:aspartate ammonia-lyase